MSMFPQIDLGRNFGQGFQIGSTIQAIGAQRQAAEAAAARAAAEEDARRKAMLTNAPEDIKNWASFDPKSFNEYSQGIERMTKDQRTQEFNAALPVFNAIQSGEITTGMKLIRQRADALRNSGQEQEADNLDLLHKQIGDGQHEKALQKIRWLMNGIDPDRFSKMMETETKLQPNTEKQNSVFLNSNARLAREFAHQRKIPEAIALLDVKIQSGKERGFNVEALEDMRNLIGDGGDGSIASMDAILSALDGSWPDMQAKMQETRLKSVQTESAQLQYDADKEYLKQKQAADVLKAQAQARKDNAEAEKTEALNKLNEQFALQDRVNQQKLEAAQARTAEMQAQNEEKFAPRIAEAKATADEANARIAQVQAGVDEKYKAENARLAAVAQNLANNKMAFENSLAQKYADRVRNAEMTKAEADAKMAEDKAAYSAQVEKANADLANFNAQIAAEKAAVAKPFEQSALAYQQAVEEKAKADAEAAKPLNDAKLAIDELERKKLERTNKINSQFEEAIAEANATKAQSEATSAAAAAAVAEETERIKLMEARRAHEQARKKENLEIDQLAANLGLTKNQITKVKVETNLLSAQAQKARLEAESFGKGIMPLEQKAKFETELRKEYTSVSEGFRNTRDAYQQLEAVKKRGTGISDQTMLNLFQRMIDPKGVVRQPDIEALMKSSGAFASVMQTLEKWKSGQKLSALQRQQIIDAAGDIYKVAEKNNNLQKKSIEKFADEYKFNKSFIFHPESSGESATSAPVPSGTVKQPTGMPKGFRVIGKE